MSTGPEEAFGGSEPEYRITVAGALDPSWAERTRGMAIEVRDGGVSGPVTVLTGVLDPSGLLGILQHLVLYGAHLISVEYVARL